MRCNLPKKHKTKVLAYLKEAVALFDGDVLSGDNNQRFKEIVYVLANVINIPPLKSNNEVKRRFIDSAIRRAKGYRKLNLYNFLRCVGIQYSNYLKQPKKKYYVVFTNNVEYPSYRGKRLFRILKTPIRVYNFSFVDRNFSFEKKTWDDLSTYGFFKKLIHKDTQNYTQTSTNSEKPKSSSFRRNMAEKEGPWSSLDRTLACGAEGPGFKSPRAHHTIDRKQ